MTRKVAIQMDALESINPRTDTTLLLGAEACRRGYEVYCYEPQTLTLNNGELTASMRRVTLRNDPDDYFTASDYSLHNLREMDVVLMRQDPPFDMAYITATHLLEMIQPDVLVVNDPAAVRNAPEKLFFFRFPQFVPPTLITRERYAIISFLEEYKEIVLKPLYGFGGDSVFYLTMQDTNLDALIETFLHRGNEPIMAQRFIPEIRKMDKRIILIDGKVTAVLGRVPSQGSIRANMRVGGTGTKIEATARDMEIGNTVAPILAEQGILLAGIDVIGEYLTEINVTSPTGLVRSNALYGIAQEQIFWGGVERRIKG